MGTVMWDRWEGNTPQEKSDWWNSLSRREKCVRSHADAMYPFIYIAEMFDDEDRANDFGLTIDDVCFVDRDARIDMVNFAPLAKVLWEMVTTSGDFVQRWPDDFPLLYFRKGVESYDDWHENHKPHVDIPKWEEVYNL